ncbi:uracil-DNA glycosylase family protein [Comamonas sediminis]|uniref:Uracil-DNA glycosylase-like domain-containing protein n=1 Tax=Comamonas sediminis TaxID=1783360 RepID=A0ABV4B4I6_9BURK
MSLNLDARQRAMLQEMGHPLWWPESPAPAAQTAPEVTPAPTPVAAVRLHAEPVPATGVTAAPAAPAAPTMPAAAIPETAAPAPAPTPAPAPAPAAARTTSPQALPADFPRVRFALRAPVLLDLQGKQPPPVAATQPAWLVVAELPEGAPQQGEACQLLLQMLRAMRLTDAPVYWVPLARIPANQEGDDGLPSYSIDALVQECQPAMALLLGLPAVRHLMPGDQPFSRLRQQLHQLGGSQLPAVVSYDPSHLLRTPQAKAATWADLCFALAQAGR